MSDATAPASYNILITGELSGRIAIGRNTVQIGQIAAGAKVWTSLSCTRSPRQR